MDIRKWAGMLKDEFYSWGNVNPAPWDLYRYKDVHLNVQGMTTPSNMHLLNLAVRCMEPNECYLEVGTWRGKTLIGALLGNDGEGVAIDNDSMDEHDGDTRSSQDVWRENVAAFGMTRRTQYVDASVPAVWETMRLRKRAGVYLFDGDKSTADAAYEGLAGVIPFLADEALIFVDDANELNIRMAVDRVCKQHRDNLHTLADIPTPGNCWPMLWNGVMILAWKRA